MEWILERELISSKAQSRLIGVFTFLTFMCLGAFVRIPLPFTPVPITLQTFFVLLSGAFLGTRLGSLTQAAYVFLGLSGLPVFTGAGSGFLYLAGPTGGYIFGFLVAVLLIGRYIKTAGNNFFSVLVLFFLADLALLACGALWLKIIFGYNLKNAILAGIFPFVPGDLIKAIAATGIYLKLKPRTEQIF